jgi:predicted nucleotidyltransferase
MSAIQQAMVLLKDAAGPSHIILLGSYGRGTPHEDSDVDFLVVLPEVRDRREEMVRLRRVLRPLRIPVDVLVVSEAVFGEWSGTPGNVLFEAAQNGQVL